MSTDSQSENPVQDSHLEADETMNEVAIHTDSVLSAPTIKEKSQILWSLSSELRHHTLNALPAEMVAAVIEGDPDNNVALLGNIPSEKFHKILSLGTFEQGRNWLERAVDSNLLAATILPSLLNARDLGEMLLTSAEYRRAVPKLLNFERAERWRQLLTTAEWHHNIDSLLLSDGDELLSKVSFKNKSVRNVLQSLIDYVPELYLETVNYSLERLKHSMDRPDEDDDITELPLSIPEILAQPTADTITAESIDDSASPLSDVLPQGADPVFSLAIAGLTTARKNLLEQQLKQLLRNEVVNTASFSEIAMQRAAGRVLSYLRQGLESFGPSVEDATRALERRNLNEIMLIGARATEAVRQKALSMAGLRDWLDSRQRQFLDALKHPEAGLHPETREPVMWLASKPKQPREEWNPMLQTEVMTRLADISVWAGLARAAFGTPERVHFIFNTAKTRTAYEAMRRTIVALALYNRWEPELVRPAEDYPAFNRQYVKGKKSNLDTVRQIVLTALDQTPADAWKPSDAKTKARNLLLRIISEIEERPLDPNAKIK